MNFKIFICVFVVRNLIAIKTMKKNRLTQQPIDNRPYFHELSDEKIELMVQYKINWGDIRAMYRQPRWCKYPDALDPQMGCWSLTDTSVEGLRTKICREYCSTCDEYKLFVDPHGN